MPANRHRSDDGCQQSPPGRHCSCRWFRDSAQILTAMATQSPNLFWSHFGTHMTFVSCVSLSMRHIHGYLRHIHEELHPAFLQSGMVPCLSCLTVPKSTRPSFSRRTLNLSSFRVSSWPDWSCIVGGKNHRKDPGSSLCLTSGGIQCPSMLCYRLTVLLKFIHWSPTPPCDGVRGGILGRWLGLDDIMKVGSVGLVPS